VRLFVAVWPPADLLDGLGRLARPAVAGVRWTTRDQWHVTLRFLGEAEPGAVVAALQRAPLPPPCTATAGPAVARLGRRVLMVPVAGLDAVAAATVAATAGLGTERPDDRPFAGHLTLARASTKGVRGPNRGPDLGALAGAPVAAAWEVDEVTVVESRLARAGARYEVLARVPLGGRA